MHFNHIRTTPSHQLANGLEVAEVNSYETDFVYREIFEENCYAKHGIEIDNSSIVFDVGANIGLFSLYVNEVAPQAKIYALEPARKPFACLEHNLLNYFVNATPINCAASHTDHNAMFSYYPGYSVISSMTPDLEKDMGVITTGMIHGAKVAPDVAKSIVTSRMEKMDSYLCPTRSISSLLTEYQLPRIDLLKIDTEGAEIDVLKGIHYSDWPKIKQVILEVHSVEDLDFLVSTLVKNHFDVVVDYDPVLRDSGISNIYARAQS